VHCAAHRLQLALRDAFEIYADEPVKKAIRVARELANATRSSKKFAQTLNNVKCGRIQLPRQTRWNSISSLAASIVKNKEQLEKALEIALAEDLPLGDLLVDEVDHEFFLIMDAFQRVLKPFKQLTDRFGSMKHTSLALVPVTMLALRAHLDRQVMLQVMRDNNNSSF